MNEQVLSTYFNPRALRLAWERMIRSTGRDAKDFFGIELYNVDLEKNINRLSDALLSSNYKPTRPFKYYEPKQSGTHRTKTVLTIDDALIYQAIGNTIGQRCYSILSKNNNAVFGCVLHPEVEQGEELLSSEEPEFYFYKFYPPLHNKFTLLKNQAIQKASTHYKLETDIVGFFDSIPHSKLLVALHKQFNIEREIVDFLGNCLNAWSGTREAIIPGVGIPQGPATSHLLANLLLYDLDNILLNQYQFSYFRYIDDIRIYDENRGNLTHALILIDNQLKAKALSINTEKTFIEEIKDKESELKQELLVSQVNDTDLNVIDIINSDLIENNTEFTDDELKDYIDHDISNEKIKLYYERMTQQVEKKMLAELSVALKNNSEQLRLKLLDKSFQRFWTHNAYQWRTLNQILPTLSIYPNDKMIDVWLFGLENFYWKANHFCWNINLYGVNEMIKRKLQNILNNKFKHYEWVRYQIISSLAISQKFDEKELEDIFNNTINNEWSELVRIGYYKLLLKHCRPDTKLWNKILNSGVFCITSTKLSCTYYNSLTFRRLSQKLLPIIERINRLFHNLTINDMFNNRKSVRSI